MGSKASSPEKLARRYALSLLAASREAGAMEAVEADLGSLDVMIEGSETLRTALKDPRVSRERHKAALTALADKAGWHALTKNFLALAAMRRRVRALPAIIAAFRQALEAERGLVRADIAAAHPLDDRQAGRLEGRLAQATGRSVKLDVRVEKDLLGGMVVTVGSVMVDDSVKSKLARLGQAMAAGTQTS